MDSSALLLARRAAEIEGLSLSAWMSKLVRQHAWASQQPERNADQQAQADERAVELDEREAAQWRDGPHRAAG